MLVAAGHPPPFPQHGFDTPSMAVARGSVEAMLAAHDPNPAMTIDRHWRVLSANKAVATLVAGVEPLILRPPVNLLRLFLHPAGLSTRIINLRQWRNHLIARLQREIDQDRDPGLIDLLEEVRDYPAPTGVCSGRGRRRVPCPLQIATIDGTLSFIAATTRFTMAMDVTLSEISIESFLAGRRRDRGAAAVRQPNASQPARPAPPLQPDHSPAAHARGRPAARG